MTEVEFGAARPDDHHWIVRIVDDWWGRPIAAALPRLFLDHFGDTSIVAEVNGTGAAFLVGFMSPAQRSAAYVHFVGVDPAHRRTGLGRALYERFFELAVADGREIVTAITNPINVRSVAFHEGLGFEVGSEINDYNQPGASAVVFTLRLSEVTACWFRSPMRFASIGVGRVTRS